MKYIDKHIHLDEGNRYTSDFLCEAFDEEELSFYPNVSSPGSYANFCAKKYRYGEGLEEDRTGFEPLLVSEQYGCCCYCMGRIESRNVALEHVVPERFGTDQDPATEFAYYAKYAPILSEKVELAQDFARREISGKDKLKSLAKYPHLISYVNIVASCHGIINDKTSCFCNHPRGNKRIVPLMLMENAERIVRYNELGMIIINLSVREEEARATIDALQLNHDTLQEVRMLWYLISRTGRTVEDVVSIDSVKERILLLKEIFNVTDYTQLSERWRNYAPVTETDSMAY